ncbi:DUF2848 domain-containing protein [Pseudaestuariivita atlantica]|uniref:DUF2848 domain-containing protein n=1 Tax=Pseudaestuariivita atlantica TaxID=1317121 RepID=A0A0L1JM48_9RHOB|nr:DUF2848 domain-containing protein [Pseudaestuariivita atlantica]KNG92830.1 hypothetical protein ATO11_15300 [Pseudaestuariivita atlantica]
MRFVVDETEIPARITSLVIAGWTGRDPAAVRHHVDELAALGVAPPSEVPLYYRVSSSLLVQSSGIEVLGTATSGEVEPVLVRLGGALYLGIGSDHTDRELEAVSVAASKQACPKPVGETLWRFEEVEARLDDLVLTCAIEEDGRWTTYQQGTLAGIRPLAELARAAGLSDNQAMFCGTLGAIGGVRPAGAYRMSLTDPASGRSLGLSYTVRTLPVVS